MPFHLAYKLQVLPIQPMRHFRIETPNRTPLITRQDFPPFGSPPPLFASPTTTISNPLDIRLTPARQNKDTAYKIGKIGLNSIWTLRQLV